MPQHFDLKNEIPVFKNASGMRDAIEYYSNHEAERHALAANARARVLKEHTYRHRAMEILSLAAWGISNWAGRLDLSDQALCIRE